MVQIPTYKDSNVESILSNAGGNSVNIPAGNYVGVFENAELKDSKSGGKFIKLNFRITQGQHADTVLIERLNVVNSNEVAVKIAYETLARIAKAVGMDTIPQDTGKICGRLLTAKVETEEREFTDKEGKLVQFKQSVISSKDYKAAPQQNDGFPTQNVGEPTQEMPWM